MGKANFAVRRTIQMVITLWAVATVLFFLFRLMPGDPTSYIVSPQMDAATRQQIIANYGLNQPLHIQYIKYLQNALVLDFGRSFHTNEPVAGVIYNYLPNTLILMLTAYVLAYTVGITAGVFAGWNRGSNFERGGVFVGLMGRSIPRFWVGIVILWIFGAWLGVIPMSGMRSIGSNPGSFLNTVLSLDFIWHMIGPVLTLGFYFTGYPLLIMRNSMLETLSQDFIDLARAKGLSERQVMFKHGARNAMLPVITAAAIAFGFAVGGQVLVEEVFGWPGIGREMIRAVLRRDYPVAQATFLVLASSVIFMNFVADLLYGFFDPRVTYD
jgi:ABC-type dipeptide/oligopeptide/nickel transport system permease component